jgi:phage anti-repressor protein
MNELIPIQDFNGKKAVSARELYEYLGFANQHWSKWYNKNILNNQFAIQNEDYAQLPLSGRSVDFVITLDFAKKLAMMARTPEGEKVRDYFIEVERIVVEKNKSLPSFAEMMLQSAQLHVEHEKKILAIEQKQTAIEEKVDQIHRIQKENQMELFNIPVSDEVAQPVELRKQVSILVNKYAVSKGIHFQFVWNSIYAELEARYHIRLSAYKKLHQDEKLIDVAARIDGVMNKLYIVISDMIKRNSKVA